jgi:CxxC motif-containing protein
LEVREVICIICPRGCRIKVYTSNGKIVKVEGYTCPRGLEYAIQEVRNPLRVLMSVVRCKGGDLPVVSIKTDKPIPRDKLLEVSRHLANIVVDAPVNIGDVIVENVLGLGANIVATRPCRRIGRD